METVITCPLGHECETAKDNKVYRCAWLVEVAGKNPQSEEVVNEKRCAMAWMPVLMVENAQTNRGQTQAIESFRNTVTQQNKKLIGGLVQAAQLSHAKENI